MVVDGTVGIAPPFDGFEATFGGPATVDNPVDEAGAFVTTSDLLPVDEFPQFESQGVAEYANPFDAIEGEWAMAADHVDNGYQRLGRTFDLTGLGAVDEPAFEAQIAFDLELGYDNILVEVRPVGTDDWTTLPDANGNTSTTPPTECEAGFYAGVHPQLLHYLTLTNPCTPTGTTGEWNALTGSSGGWIPVSYDLSAYAGQQIELVVSYATDPGTGGLGVIIDDTKLVTTGGRRPRPRASRRTSAPGRCSAPPRRAPTTRATGSVRRASPSSCRRSRRPTRSSSGSASSSSTRMPHERTWWAGSWPTSPGSR